MYIIYLGNSCSLACYHLSEKLSTMGHGAIFHNPLGSSCSMVCYHINEKLSTMRYGTIFHNLWNLDLITKKKMSIIDQHC
jgi:hypothetical protein